MTAPPAFRRATLLGVAIVVSACDIAEFALDPMPRFEQTWNLPASSDTISIASLLPADNSVRITPDSNAFQLSSANIAISKAVVAADACSSCLALAGTRAPKPSFTMVASNAAALATDVVTASIVSGTVNIVLTNTMSFDPLRVTASGAGTQGHMVIIIRSGSVVFGRDSLNGATTTWAPNDTLNRVITLSSGAALGPLAAEVMVVSPAGDSAFIDGNSRLSASASGSLNVASVSMNVTGRTLRSDSTEIDLSDLETGITDKVVSGALRMTITNPLAISGNVDVRFTYGPGQSVAKVISLPSGAAQVRTVALTRADLDNLFGRKVMVTVSGAVSSTAPLTLTPRLKIIVDNRMILTIRTGEGQ